MTHLAAVHPQASDGEETIWTPAAARMAQAARAPALLGAYVTGAESRGAQSLPWFQLLLVGSFTKHFLSS